MIELDYTQADIIKPLFEYSSDTLVLSFLQGHMGRAWADSVSAPSCAMIITADFCFFAGDHEAAAAASLVKDIPEGYDSGLLMIPQNEAWGRLIEKFHPRSSKITRYAMKKDTVFSTKKLNKYVDNLANGYKIAKINGALYHKCLKNPAMTDLCSQFLSEEDYLRRGMGFCVLHNGEIVSGASSYTVYSGGIEIEVDTAEAYRRRGLAAACAARLILECLREGKYPSWDAANKDSVALAEKLGYELAFEYTAYDVDTAKR